jgi:predicted RNA-binding Zn-ribbon protein involved in translation (DUF1610 family)
MTTNIPTIDITDEEVRILLSTEDELNEHGKTDVKCPRCGGSIVITDFDSSYTIGCEFDCVKVGFRGI